MGLLTGTISGTWYRALSKCLPDAKERYNRSLKRRAFQEINADKGETQSVGWVDPRNILAPSITWDGLSVGPYLLLGMRIDRKSVPGVLVKAHVRRALKELAKEKKNERISRTEKRAIEERVTAELLRQSSPSVSIQESVWNTATGEILLASTSKGANEAFVELFEATFEIELAAANPLARAADIAATAGHPEGVAGLRPSFWGTGPRIAAVHDVESLGQEG